MKLFLPATKLALGVAIRRESDPDKLRALRQAYRDRDIQRELAARMRSRFANDPRTKRRAVGDGTWLKLLIESLPQILEFVLAIIAAIN